MSIFQICFIFLVSLCSTLIASIHSAFKSAVRWACEFNVVNYLSRKRQREESLRTSTSLSVFSTLPSEIIDSVLIQVASPYINQPLKILLLSKYYHSLIIPKLYHFIILDNQVKFRKLKDTLALYNPQLGKHVKFLSIASSTFDDGGYLPDSVSGPIALSTGLELILLSTPNLIDLHLDLFSLGGLHSGTCSKLPTSNSRRSKLKRRSVEEDRDSTRPIRLSTELTFSGYFKLPIFSNLRHLELLTFGLDEESAEDLKRNCKRLRSLTLRLVSTKEKHSRRDALKRIKDEGWNHPGLESSSTRSGNRLEEEQDLEDLRNFIKAVEVLREGGWGEEEQFSSSDDEDEEEDDSSRMGMNQSSSTGKDRKVRCPHRKLRCLTIFTDPFTLNSLKNHYHQEIINSNGVEIIKSEYEVHKSWTLRDEFLIGLDSNLSSKVCKECNCIQGGVKDSLKASESHSKDRRASEKEDRVDKMIFGIIEQSSISAHPPDPHVRAKQDEKTLLRLTLDRNWEEGPRKGSRRIWVQEREDGIWN